MDAHRIDWDYPQPISRMDRFIGPGATRTERILQLSLPLAFGLAWPVLAILNGWEWTVLQMAAATILGFDLLGGIITNSTSSAKRWYHRQGQGARNHIGFVLLHVVQLAILNGLFLPAQWRFTILGYGYLLAASALILSVPLYLKRPVAFSAFVVGILLSQYALPAPNHLEWFLPGFYLKILVAHLVPESPFRPASEFDGPPASPHEETEHANRSEGENQ